MNQTQVNLGTPNHEKDSDWRPVDLLVFIFQAQLVLRESSWCNDFLLSFRWFAFRPISMCELGSSQSHGVEAAELKF